MTIEIGPLDRTDSTLVAQVQALRVAAEAVDVPDFPPPCPYAFRAELDHHSPYKAVEHHLARRDGEVVGLLTLELPQTDNRENAEVVLTVHPDRRRQGVGYALHSYLREVLRRDGRKRYFGACVEGLPEGPPRRGAGSRFAEAVGATRALTEVRSRLDLAAVDEREATERFAEAARAGADYQLVTWQGWTPDEYAADSVYLTSRLISDAPMEELVWEPPTADVQRLREGERLHERARRRMYRAGAVHRATGRLVAITALAVHASAPWHAFQWVTLVDPDHRGHRLGTLVKWGNLRYIREHEPELRVVDTWNAEANRHMRAINEAMGFRPVDRWVNCQREV